jgi:hypothetical protein
MRQMLGQEAFEENGKTFEENGGVDAKQRAKLRVYKECTVLVVA